MLGIIGFIFVLGAGILIHEIGHFVVARKAGILCYEFSIGMGPALWKYRRGETTYALRAIPIGGYVLMAGEEIESEMVKIGQTVSLILDPSGRAEKIILDGDPGAAITGVVKEADIYRRQSLDLEMPDGGVRTFAVSETAVYIDPKSKQEQRVAPYDRCMESKSKLARVSVMAAGAIMNFILAFVLVFIVGLVQGEPLGTTRLSVVSPDSPAAAAGLLTGDVIVAYDGRDVDSPEDLIYQIQNGQGEVAVVFTRDGARHETTLMPGLEERDGQQVQVIGINMAVDHQFSFRYAIDYSLATYSNLWGQIFYSLNSIFITHEHGIRDLSGPVGIFVMTDQVARNHGIFPVIILAALININLGILNLLPLPALDGGRILFIIIESIIGRPVSRRVEGIIHTTGFFLFMGLFVFIFFNDIVRIISG